jgi:hypothetical protein
VISRFVALSYRTEAAKKLDVDHVNVDELADNLFIASFCPVSFY